MATSCTQGRDDNGGTALEGPLEGQFCTHYCSQVFDDSVRYCGSGPDYETPVDEVFDCSGCGVDETPEAPTACQNTNGDHVDSYGTNCTGANSYSSDPSFCAYATGDTEDFSANIMCCACELYWQNKTAEGVE